MTGTFCGGFQVNEARVGDIEYLCRIHVVLIFLLPPSLAPPLPFYFIFLVYELSSLFYLTLFSLHFSSASISILFQCRGRLIMSLRLDPPVHLGCVHHVTNADPLKCDNHSIDQLSWNYSSTHILLVSTYL